MPDAPFHAGLAASPPGTRAVLADAGGVRLRVVLTTPGARGTILIFPGRTEYAEKYGQVMTRLAGLGFGSVVIDWRGQGLSTRPGNSTALGHVRDFAEYQADIAAMLALPDVVAMPGPRHLLCHSMGGCIGLRALSAGLEVERAVFSAPMWGIGLAPALSVFARALSFAATRLGFGTSHALGGDAGFYVQKQAFSGNQLTSDPEIYGWLQGHLAAQPDLGLGGPSFGWLDAAFREMAALRQVPPPTLPVLGFLGADEAIVLPDAVRRGMDRLPQGRLLEVPGARHEILLERAEVQTALWREVDRFLP